MIQFRRVAKRILKRIPFSLSPSITIPGTPFSLSIHPKKRRTTRRRIRASKRRVPTPDPAFDDPLEQTIHEIAEHEKKRAIKKRDYPTALIASWVQSNLKKKKLQ